MFRRWLLVLCSLLCLSGTATTTGATTCAVEKDVRDVMSFVSADVQYGWQVSGGAVSVYEMPAN